MSQRPARGVLGVNRLEQCQAVVLAKPDAMRVVSYLSLFDGLLAAAPFLPPRAITIVPLKNPMAKKAKYMMPDFCLISATNGGKRNVTGWELYMPIITS